MTTGDRIVGVELGLHDVPLSTVLETPIATGATLTSISATRLAP